MNSIGTLGTQMPNSLSSANPRKGLRYFFKILSLILEMQNVLRQMQK